MEKVQGSGWGCTCELILCGGLVAIYQIFYK